jgi:hypothetical protein
VWGVVKANAYGHGIERVYEGLRAVDGFALLDLDEAQRVRALGWRGPILLLEGAFEPRDLELCSRLDLWHVVHCTEQIDMLNRSLAEYRARFSSPALLALADEISALASDARFSLVSGKFPDACGGYVYPTGVLLGFNLTENAEISALKPIKIEGMPNAKKPVKKTAKDNPSSPDNILSDLLPLEVTPALLRGAASLLQRSASAAAAEAVAYVKQVTSPLRALRKDIIFCCSACRLRQSWHDAGMPSCFP